MNHFVGMQSMMETRFGIGQKGADLNEDMAHARQSGQLNTTGLFGGFSLGAVVERFRARRLDRKQRLHLSAATLRLAQTSPHLLSDVGLEELPEVVVRQDLRHHLAQDVAVVEKPASAEVIAIPVAKDQDETEMRYRLAAE